MTPADQHALREALADEAVARFCRDCEQVHRKLNDEEVWLIQSFAHGPYIARAAEAENTRLKETVEAAPLRPDVLAAAWNAWHARHGGKLGPGPAFVEALQAALRVLATIPPKENHDA